MHASLDAICSQIRGVLGYTRWTLGDLASILSALRTTDGPLEAQTEACKRIWMQVGVFLKKAWERGSDSASRPFRMAIDFVSSLATDASENRSLMFDIYIPGLLSALQCRTMTGSDASIVQYLLVESSILQHLPPCSDADFAFHDFLQYLKKCDASTGLPELATSVMASYGRELNQNELFLNDSFGNLPTTTQMGVPTATVLQPDFMSSPSNLLASSPNACVEETYTSTTKKKGIKRRHMDNNGMHHQQQLNDCDGASIQFHTQELEKHLTRIIDGTEPNVDVSELISLQSRLAKMIQVCCTLMSN